MRLGELIAEKGPGALAGGAILGVCIGGLALLGGNWQLGLMLFVLCVFSGSLVLLFHEIGRHQQELESTARLDAAELVLPAEQLEVGPLRGEGAPIGPPPFPVHLPVRRPSLLLLLVAWAGAALSAAGGVLALDLRPHDWPWQLGFALLGVAGFGGWGLKLATWLVAGRRLGIFVDADRLTLRRAGYGRVVTVAHAWDSLGALGVEKESLRIGAAAQDHQPTVLPVQWVVIRAREFLAWRSGRTRQGEARRVLLALEEKLAGARCVACKAPLEVRVVERQPPCAHCGCPDPLVAELQDGLRKMAGLFADLRRGNGAIRTSFLRQLLDGDSRARWRIVGPAVQAFLYVLVLALPVGAAMWFGFEHVWWSMLLPPAVGTAAVGLVAWPTWWALVAMARRHAGPLAAIEVSVEGEARCRCCGAPLPGSDVVRECPHCRGANVVAPATARKVAPLARDAVREALADAGVAWLAAQRMFETIAGQLGVFSVLAGGAVALAGWLGSAEGGDRRWYLAGAAVTLLVPGAVLLAALRGLRRLARALETGDLSLLR